MRRALVAVVASAVALAAVVGMCLSPWTAAQPITPWMVAQANEQPSHSSEAKDDPLAADARYVTAVGFSPDGKQVASSDQKHVSLWDAATGRLIQKVARRQDGRLSLAFPFSDAPYAPVTPDGKTVALGYHDGVGVVRLYSTTTGKEIGHLKQGGNVEAATFSPDGKLLAAASWAFAAKQGFDHRFIIWDAATRKKIRLLSGTEQNDNELRGKLGVAFSPDGRWLATTSWDGTVRLWEVSTGKEVHRLAEDRGVHGIAFSPDATLAWAAYDQIYLADVANRKVLRTVLSPDDNISSVAFSPDGKTVVSGGWKLQLWDVATGKVIRLLATLGP